MDSVITEMRFAGFVRHQQVHVVLAIAARMHRLIGFLGAITVTEHAAHRAAVAIGLASYGMSSAIGRVLNAVNGATYYCTGSTSHRSAFCSCAKIITIGAVGWASS